MSGYLLGLSLGLAFDAWLLCGVAAAHRLMESRWYWPLARWSYHRGTLSRAVRLPYRLVRYLLAGLVIAVPAFCLVVLVGSMLFTPNAAVAAVATVAAPVVLREIWRDA